MKKIIYRITLTNRHNTLNGHQSSSKNFTIKNKQSNKMSMFMKFLLAISKNKITLKTKNNQKH